jgi:serine/threonine-protein kinase
VERSPPAVGDTVGDKYKIEAELGRGGMGTVFSARHVLTDRKVALKWMLPDTKHDPLAADRFLREARAMGRIDHPRVVGILDVGSDGPATFLVMELLRGEPLRARMARVGPVDAATAVQIVVPALEGLAAAHRLGIVHRDLKPENLFLVPEPPKGDVTKVLDFGISKVQGEHLGPVEALTQSGVTMGTPSYMSPEQVRGSRDLDSRTDVWAMGVILYELLEGRTPFRAESYGALLVAIATEPFAPMERAQPEALREVVAKALDKDPEARFPSVEALAQALLPFGAAGVSFHPPRALSAPPGAPSARPLEPRKDDDLLAREPVPTAGPTRLAGPSRKPPAAAPEPEPVPHAAPAPQPPRARIVAIAVALGLLVLAGLGIQRLSAETPPTTPATLEPAPTPTPTPSPPPALAPTPTPALAPAPEPAPALAPEPEPEPTPAPTPAPTRRRPPEASPEPSPAVRGRSGALSREDF